MCSIVGKVYAKAEGKREHEMKAILYGCYENARGEWEEKRQENRSVIHSFTHLTNHH